MNSLPRNLLVLFWTSMIIASICYGDNLKDFFLENYHGPLQKKGKGKIEICIKITLSIKPSPNESKSVIRNIILEKDIINIFI